MSDIKNKLRIIDASSDPRVTNNVWTNCDKNALVIDSKNGGIYRGNGTNKLSVIVENNNQKIIDTTYDTLKSLRDNSQLVPGQLYKITDYETKLDEWKTIYYYDEEVGEEWEEYIFVGYEEHGYEGEYLMPLDVRRHCFDIIVMAISKNELSEEAYAAHSPRDSYFDNRNLSAWKVWYRLDNEHEFWGVPRYGGKGVIYRLINEYGNECPFDFENVWYNDKPVFGENCKNNKIDGYYITLGDNCENNIIEKNSMRIILGNNCKGNTFGVECRGIRLGNFCNYNKFGNNCIYPFDWDYGTLGGGFWMNIYTPRNYCSYNTFANGCTPHIECPLTSSSYNTLNNLYINVDKYSYYVEEGSGREEDGGTGEYKYSASILLTNNGILRADSEIRIGKDSNENIKIYKIEDLIQ